MPQLREALAAAFRDREALCCQAWGLVEQQADLQDSLKVARRREAEACAALAGERRRGADAASELERGQLMLASLAAKRRADREVQAELLSAYDALLAREAEAGAALTVRLDRAVISWHAPGAEGRFSGLPGMLDRAALGACPPLFHCVQEQRAAVASLIGQLQAADLACQEVSTCLTAGTPL